MGVGHYPQAGLGAPVSRAAHGALWLLATAACLVLVAVGWWSWQWLRQVERKGVTSKAVAMLNGMVDVQWSSGTAAPQVGAPLDPGWLRLESGLI